MHLPRPKTLCRSLPLLLVGGALALFGPFPSRALTWHWTASFGSNLNGAPPFSGYGTFETDGSSVVIGQIYQITGITGFLVGGPKDVPGSTLNGGPITGLGNFNSATNTFKYLGNYISTTINGISFVYNDGGYVYDFNINCNILEGSYAPQCQTDSWFGGDVTGGPMLSSTLAPQPPSAPAPLPLIGAGAAFTLSRRLRRRLAGTAASAGAPSSAAGRS